MFYRVSFQAFWFQKDRFARQEGDSLFGIDEYVFDGGADCIHECHQGLTLEVGAQENKEDLINKAFPRVD